MKTSLFSTKLPPFKGGWVGLLLLLVLFSACRPEVKDEPNDRPTADTTVAPDTAIIPARDNQVAFLSLYRRVKTRKAQRLLNARVRNHSIQRNTYINEKKEEKHLGCHKKSC